MEEFYLVRKLSAAKIAALYGLKYKNPKVAESAVLYQLKKHDIPRRDSAAHIRKVTKELVDEWVRRYQAGESLKQIAGGTVDPVTVWNHLKLAKVTLRNKVDAQIAAVTKHQRSPFNLAPEDRVYLLGLTQGDLYVTVHGRLVRVKTASTHPAMFGLLEMCFGRFGPCYLAPKTSTLTGYEWTYTYDLHPSFGFLLGEHAGIPESARGHKFFHYLAGFFDAEGSIFMNSSGWFELSVANSNVELLRKLRGRLGTAEISSQVVYAGPTALSPKGEMWHLRVSKRADVRQLLERLPLRHPEKVKKRRIALQRYKPLDRAGYQQLFNEWETLLDSIKRERDEYVMTAEAAYKSRREKRLAGASTTGPLPPANNSNPRR